MKGNRTPVRPETHAPESWVAIPIIHTGIDMA
jgi:hypothetical protein